MRNRSLSKTNLWFAIAAAATLAACSGDNSPGGSSTGSGSGAGSSGSGSGVSSTGSFGSGTASGSFGSGSFGSGSFGSGTASGSFGSGSFGSGTASGSFGSGTASGSTSGTSSGMAGSGMAGSGMAGSGMAGSGMANGDAGAAPSFAMVYMTIISAHCATCHSPGAGHAGYTMGMLDMSSEATAYTNLVGVAAMAAVCTGKGMRVVAGDSAMSILYTKVAAANVPTCGPKMPATGAKLTAAQVATIKAWIDGGAKM